MSKRTHTFISELHKYLHTELIQLGKFKIEFETEGKYMGISLKNTYMVTIMSYRDGRAMLTIKVKENPKDVSTQNNVGIYDIPQIILRFAINYENKLLEEL